MATEKLRDNEKIIIIDCVIDQGWDKIAEKLISLWKLKGKIQK